MTLLPTYEMSKNPPEFISYDDYGRWLQDKYQELLDREDPPESAFQSFFEKHPCMLPGFNEGNPSHGAHFWAVVTQPVIGDEIKRKPDFMWLLETSLELIPVFIEIERPSKEMFRQSDDVQNAKFTQASDQILEWKTLLDSSDVRSAFYERYSVPDRLRGCTFSPRYILVYGRRREYEGNGFLANKRAKTQESGFELMSFDRLVPSFDVMRYATVKIDSLGAKRVISVPPTFQLGPTIADCVAEWTGFSEAIDSSGFLSEERKQFLKERYGYWCAWAREPDRGVYETGFWE